MAITEKTRDNGEKYYIYNELKENVLFAMIEELAETLGKYVDKIDGLNLEDLRLDQALIGEAYSRVDKRKDYFVIYHDDTQMNELKETALLIYWILKFKPISIIDEKKKRENPFINETFAIFLIYSTIKEETKRNSNMVFDISKEYTAKLSYALKFWNLDKEALILVVESLCEGMTIKRS